MRSIFATAPNRVTPLKFIKRPLVAAYHMLYRVSPRAYRGIEKFYRSTNYYERKNRRIAAFAERALQLRLPREVQLIEQHLNGEWFVHYGPFAGMKYIKASCGSVLAPKIIGSYESPIHSWIDEAIATHYTEIVDVGCADGYYAVGFALKSPESAVFAYDFNPEARQQCLAMAQLNGVADRMVIREKCDVTELGGILSSKTLIFCDIEGGEIDLLNPKVIPSLQQADIIVETHNDLVLGVTELMVERFLNTHRIDIIYYSPALIQSYPVLDRVPSDLREFMLDELRPKEQSWVRMRHY